MSQILKLPMGQVGEVIVSEAGGVVSVAGSISVEGGAIKLGFSLEGGIPALLKLASASATNPLLKGVLDKVAEASALLP